MLKHRTLTAMVIVPILIAILIFFPPIVFFYFSSAIVLIGAGEWSFLMGVKQFPAFLIYPLVLFLVMIMSTVIPVNFILYAGFIFWIVASTLVFFYPKGSLIWGKSIFLKALMGIFVLIPAWIAINLLLNSDGGLYRLGFLLVIICGADIAAYFIGRKWGKHKLAPEVSPGKTWEGVIGGVLIVLIITLIVLSYSDLPILGWLRACLLSIITVLFSILGDLYESMMKRNAGMKDSSRLLPGHGGILDRIDSLTAAAPIFAVGIQGLF